MAAIGSTRTKSTDIIHRYSGSGPDTFTALSTILNAATLAAVQGGVQDLDGAGAVNLTTLVTKWGTTGANAGTLADGSQGQLKIIMMDADGGDGTLTPANLGNGTTITFNDVGDTVLLVFINADWWVVSNQGCTVA